MIGDEDLSRIADKPAAAVAQHVAGVTAASVARDIGRGLFRMVAWVRETGRDPATRISPRPGPRAPGASVATRVQVGCFHPVC